MSLHEDGIKIDWMGTLDPHVIRTMDIFSGLYGKGFPAPPPKFRDQAEVFAWLNTMRHYEVSFPTPRTSGAIPGVSLTIVMESGENDKVTAAANLIHAANVIWDRIEERRRHKAKVEAERKAKARDAVRLKDDHDALAWLQRAAVTYTVSYGKNVGLPPVDVTANFRCIPLHANCHSTIRDAVNTIRLRIYDGYPELKDML